MHYLEDHDERYELTARKMRDRQKDRQTDSQKAWVTATMAADGRDHTTPRRE
jgi:hypothetical protein